MSTPPGREQTPARFPRSGELIVPLLVKAQSAHGYLPMQVLEEIAARCGSTLEEILGIASFYPSMRLMRPGAHTITLCNGISCHARGSGGIIDEFERVLDLRSGESTWDNEFTLIEEYCLGICPFGPVVMLDNKYVFGVQRSDVAPLLLHAKSHGSGEAPAEAAVFHVAAACPSCGESLMDAGHPIDGLPSILLIGVARHIQGWIRLSSVYSSYHIETEFPIDPGLVMNFYCPSCNAELAENEPCPECAAPTARLRMPGGASLLFCARRGCTAHKMVARDIDRGAAPKQKGNDVSPTADFSSPNS